MKRSIMPVLGLIALASLVTLAGAAAPKVVKATPDNGQNDVDPGTVRELRVVFDQPMDVGGRSIVGGGDTFPKFVGKPRWENNKTTVVWLMKLEPDHDYWLSINNESFANFKNAKGASAEPYPISFHTRAGAAAASSQPAAK